jgi:hypothetical protein
MHFLEKSATKTNALFRKKCDKNTDHVLPCITKTQIVLLCNTTMNLSYHMKLLYIIILLCPRKDLLGRIIVHQIRILHLKKEKNLILVLHQVVIHQDVKHQVVIHQDVQHQDVFHLHIIIKNEDVSNLYKWFNLHLNLKNLVIVMMTHSAQLCDKTVLMIDFDSSDYVHT